VPTIDIASIIASLVTVIVVLVLLIRTMNTKRNNPNNSKVEHAIMLEKLNAISDTLERIENKLGK